MKREILTRTWDKLPSEAAVGDWKEGDPDDEDPVDDAVGNRFIIIIVVIVIMCCWLCCCYSCICCCICYVCCWCCCCICVNIDIIWIWPPCCDDLERLLITFSSILEAEALGFLGSWVCYSSSCNRLPQFCACAKFPSDGTGWLDGADNDLVVWCISGHVWIYDSRKKIKIFTFYL